MGTKQEKLLENYYKKVAAKFLSQYRAPITEEDMTEHRHFREMYLLMICTCEAVGDFDFARILDNAYVAVVGISCRLDVMNDVSNSLTIAKQREVV